MAGCLKVYFHTARVVLSKCESHKYAAFVYLPQELATLARANMNAAPVMEAPVDNLSPHSISI